MAVLHTYHNFLFANNNKLAKKAFSDSSGTSAVFYTLIPTLILILALVQALIPILGLPSR